ncbi:methyltransferase domain-containing protein [Candidatus Binatus soli]|jgi:SAM-dependent methyltransferase|uniref:methyltransferase domain-containing protein n=1 Tax=Candidatus Binatus soli TaxID=1953413 RepID=UPI003D0F4519
MEIPADIYVCPSCKGPLAGGAEAFDCGVCQTTYPIVDRIPDLTARDLDSRINPVLRVMNVPLISRLYETKLWYPVILKVIGGSKAPSFGQLMDKVGAIVGAESGMVLDVACGPGTLGRRIASPTRTVYGVDISWSMLRQAAAYVTQAGLANVQFARASVDALPFPAAFFNVALCGGALHLFPDTVAALREIARVMKPGALLAVTTFTPAHVGILRFQRVRERIEEHGGRLFELPQLEGYLTQAGFEGFRPQLDGSVLTFAARKRV